MVLDGRDSDVTRALEKRMQDASEQLDFERAAMLRDQLVALRKLQAEQSIDAGTGRDVDAFAISGEPGDYAVSALIVRDQSSEQPIAAADCREAKASQALKRARARVGPPRSM